MQICEYHARFEPDLAALMLAHLTINWYQFDHEAAPSWEAGAAAPMMSP